MAPLARFDPPAYLQDFDGIPGQRDAWHRFVSAYFDLAIDYQRELVGTGTVQYYNAARFEPAGPVLAQAVPWNAFPKVLLRRLGRERALQEADTLWPLTRYSPRIQGPLPERTFYRPHDEYCEWRVERDGATGHIRRVTFTSEPPEYWQALFGDTLSVDAGLQVDFPGDRQRVLALYRELVGPQVQLEDLIAPEDLYPYPGAPEPWVRRGHYNPYNKWNTTHGCVHLSAPPNSLTAQIFLGADSTILYRNARGERLVEPEPLLCCGAYGGPDRHSDPTIAATVNALARAGFYVTLRNPVAVYLERIDLAGWQAPDGRGVADCVRVVRGQPGMAVRLVVEVPPERGFSVSELTIGGEPIRYGGQIAECITVKLVGQAASAGAVSNGPTDCFGKCCIDPNEPRQLRLVGVDSPPPAGMQPAFVEQGTAESNAAAPMTAAMSARGLTPGPARGPARQRQQRHTRRQMP